MFVLESIKKYAESDILAIINREEKLSYKELETKSEAFAAFLMDYCGKDQAPIVIYGHKEMEFLPCVFGALKSGRAYVPIDVTIPTDRIEQIIENVQPKVLVDLYGLEIEEKSNIKVIRKNELKELLNTYKNIIVHRDNWIKDSDNCYILFTSGSTGKPKGVPITKKNIDNLAKWVTPWCRTKEDKAIITNQISYSFDVSVISIYIGISLGKTLFTIDKGMMENLQELYSALERSQIAFWVSTPSFAEMCCVSEQFNGSMLPQLETFLFCGETLTHKLVDTLKERFQKVKVVNTYGPTEATVLVTAVEVTDEMARVSLPIPIGYPLEEVLFKIVDPKGNEVLEGETGELLIISDSVSKGYYKREDLTVKAFFDTEEKGQLKRGYRTGDACYQKEGLYYFGGRIDFQVKLNGYRIELEDIEANLTKVENVSRAVVLPIFKDEKIEYLAAFVMLSEKSELPKLKQIIKIKEDLKKYIPSYMIPRKIIIKESFPVNTNGKIDRKELSKEL